MAERGDSNIPIALAAITLVCCGGVTDPGSGSGRNDAAPDTMSCTMTVVTNMNESSVCIEESGFSSDEQERFKGVCNNDWLTPPSDAGPSGTSQKLSYADRPCSRESALGGCRDVLDELTVTDWYYDSGSHNVAGVQELCARLGETFVPP